MELRSYRPIAAELLHTMIVRFLPLMHELNRCPHILANHKYKQHVRWRGLHMYASDTIFPDYHSTPGSIVWFSVRHGSRIRADLSWGFTSSIGMIAFYRISRNNVRSHHDYRYCLSRFAKLC